MKRFARFSLHSLLAGVLITAADHRGRGDRHGDGDLVRHAGDGVRAALHTGVRDPEHPVQKGTFSLSHTLSLSLSLCLSVCLSLLMCHATLNC